MYLTAAVGTASLGVRSQDIHQLCSTKILNFTKTMLMRYQNKHIDKADAV